MAQELATPAQIRLCFQLYRKITGFQRYKNDASLKEAIKAKENHDFDIITNRDADYLIRRLQRRAGVTHMSILPKRF